MHLTSLLLRPGIGLLGLFRLPGRLLLLGAVALLPLAAWGARGGSTGWGLGIAVGGWLLIVYLLLCWTSMLRRDLRALATGLDALRRGDLSKTAEIAGDDEFAALRREVEQAKRRYSGIVATVRSEAQLVAMAGEQLLRQADEMSDGTSRQASSLEETSASVTELSGSVTRNAHAVQAADALAGRVRSSADEGLRVVAEAVESMQGLERRAQQMNEIIGVIDGIAFQTNILALNAAVEAARAGEHGRGFAVVAGEVRTLAQRSAQAAAEVKQLIDGSSADIHAGVALIRESTQALDSVASGIRELADTLRGVSASSVQQSSGLQEIAAAVGDIDQLTQRHAHTVDVAVQAAQRLREQARQISAAAIDVKLRQGCADEARALVEKTVAHLRAHGKQATIDAIHDPRGPFRDRDMFVFLLDGNNHFRAFGVDPSKAGRPAVAAPGVDIEALCAQTHAAASAGGGWIAFKSMHPATGAVVEKLGYALTAVDDWVAMCSINRADGSVDAAPRQPSAAPATARLAAA